LYVPKIISDGKLIEKKTFGCPACGFTYEAYPLDDFHNLASLDKELVDDPKEIKYQCENCGQEHTLYWGKEKKERGVVVKV